LKKYKSLKKISEVTLEELELVEGIDEKTAKAVFDFFHN
jgi:ERCC4-type nuclease